MIQNECFRQSDFNNMPSVRTVSSLPRVVILGSGWGSYSVLKTINKKLYRVIMVSPRNHFLFTPLLCSTTVGTLEFRSIIEPVRNAGFRRAQDFHLASAESVDFKEKTLTCRSVFDPTNEYKIDYDKLVIGVGALPNTFGIPGVQEHGIFLKEITDARAIRRRLLANFEQSLEPGLSKEERSRLLHTIIVGGGPTGVEFGAELHDFCQEDVRRLYRQLETQAKVTLIESNEILSSFDKRLRQYAERTISKRENFTLLKTSVTEIRKDSVVLADGSILPCGLVVWSAGLAPQNFISALNVEKNKQGQILTDSYLKVKSDTRGQSFAIGDCADIENFSLPTTAQVAERQGRYISRQLNDEAYGKSVQPFRFKSMGMLAYIGNYEALSDLPEFKLSGFTSWFLWRSAYLTRLGSWRLRLQVPLDWTKTLLFGRDTSRF